MAYRYNHAAILRSYNITYILAIYSLYIRVLTTYSGIPAKTGAVSQIKLI